MLKRGGWGHNVMGIEGMQSGELAVACPSCPHPGINLLLGWEDVPRDKQSVLFHFITLLQLTMVQISLSTCHLHGCKLPPEEPTGFVIFC